MMKLLTVLCIVVASLVSGAVVRPTNRSGLSVGFITNGDRLLHRQYLYKPAVPNAVQYQDFIFRGNATTRIAAITANEVGYSQNAFPWITAGGVGYSYATVRVQSARGLGYYYVIDVWGR